MKTSIFLLLIAINNILSIEKSELLSLSQLSKSLPSMNNIRVCIYENNVNIQSFTSTISSFSGTISNLGLPTEAIQKINAIVYASSITYQSFSVFIGSPYRDIYEIIEGNINEIIGIVKKTNDDIEVVFANISVKGYIFKMLDPGRAGMLRAPHFAQTFFQGNQKYDKSYVDSCEIFGHKDGKYPIIGRFPSITYYKNRMFIYFSRHNFFSDFQSISSDESYYVKEYLSYYGYVRLRFSI